MPSGAAVPPRSLQHPSAQSPAWLSLAPRNPGLGLSLRGRAWPRFFSALPFKAYPGCQPHAEEGTAICPGLCPYELISRPPPALGFRTSCHINRRRKLLIGWWKKGWGLSPQLGPARTPPSRAV